MAKLKINSKAEPARPTAPIAPFLLSVDECAEAMRLSRSTVYNLMRSGEVKFVKIGGRRLVPVEAVKTYVAGLMEVGA